MSLICTFYIRNRSNHLYLTVQGQIAIKENIWHAPKDFKKDFYYLKGCVGGGGGQRGVWTTVLTLKYCRAKVVRK